MKAPRGFSSAVLVCAARPPACPLTITGEAYLTSHLLRLEMHLWLQVATSIMGVVYAGLGITAYASRGDNITGIVGRTRRAVLS
jgi:hypothetical protein